MSNELVVLFTRLHPDAQPPVQGSALAAGWDLRTVETCEIKKGISTNLVNKVAEGSPHVVEFIKDGKIDMIINTTENKQAIKDSFTIRRTAVDLNVPYFTNLRSAKILYKSLISLKNSEISVKAIQNHHVY